MNFKFECDGYDGLILMDKSYLDEMNDELLFSMEYLLDYYGKTELIYDHPDEKWEDVRQRESEAIRKYCNSGKMIIYLKQDGEYDCKFQILENDFDASKCLHIPSGELLAVNAGELIQCALYPELNMDKIFEKRINKGWYLLSSLIDGKISYCYTDGKAKLFNNIQEY